MKKIINLGFILNLSNNWLGGLNYYYNLLSALDKNLSSEINVFIFLGHKASKENKEKLSRYGKVIESSLFDRGSISWFFNKLIFKILRSNFLTERLLGRYNIDVVSHSNIVSLKNIKTINWIPDFQHVYLPKLFSKKEIFLRDAVFKNYIKNSDAVVVSSKDSLKHLNDYCPGGNAFDLSFVSVPPARFLSNASLQSLKEKYGITGEFFFLPNQLWAHKNHLIVLEALKKLKDQGHNYTIICTGNLNDDRDPDFRKKIEEFVVSNRLKKNIRFLGLIDYEDVFGLMKYSKAVINPSLFEGWSSTVEECKSIGKPMILSDLAVHLEQYPEAIFFNKYDSDDLALKIKEFKPFEVKKYLNVDERLSDFAARYLEIIQKIVN